MDLSKLSTEDLLALKSGDLGKVSTEGLQAIKGQINPSPSVTEDVTRSAASGIARGLPTAIDVPAAALATGVEKLTGSKGSLKDLFQQNMSNGLNTGANKVFGQEYQPQTELGKIAKGAGMGVVTLPLGGPLNPTSVLRAAGTGALGTVGSQAGGAVGQAVGGDTGEVIGNVVGGLAGGYGGFKSPEGIDQGLASAGKGAQTVRAGINARGADALDAQVSNMKQASSALYRQSREAGATLTPQATNSILSSIDTSLQDTGKLHPTLHNDTMSALSDLKDSIKAGPISLEELDQQRKLLSGVINKNRVSNPEDAFKANKALDALDDAVDSLKASDINSGDRSALDALQQGRAQWAQAKKFENVTNVIKSADGDPNRLKAGLQRFVNNPKMMRGFSEDERSALMDAARNSTSEKLFKMAGKFGIDLGSSLTPGNTALPAMSAYMGGISGGPAVVAGGTAARQLQKYLARGKAEQALQAIQAPPLPTDVIRRRP